MFFLFFKWGNLIMTTLTQTINVKKAYTASTIKAITPTSLNKKIDNAYTVSISKNDIKQTKATNQINIERINFQKTQKQNLRLFEIEQVKDRQNFDKRQQQETVRFEATQISKRNKKEYTQKINRKVEYPKITPKNSFFFRPILPSENAI